MKILHVGYSDLAGGGNIAAYRIHRALVDEGHRSKMIVARKLSTDKSVLTKGLFRFDRWRKIIFRVEKILQRVRFGIEASKLSHDTFGINLAKVAKQFNADIVNLHWTHNSFVALKSICQVKVPVVWTFHDMLMFTGGCHYTDGCRNFERRCGCCPLLSVKANANDVSRRNMILKERFLERKPDAIVAPSLWMKDEVKASSLFGKRRVECIPYCLADHWFDALDRDAIRREIGIPDGTLAILFASNSGAADKRKGFDLLDEALKVMRSRWPEMKLVVLVVGGEKQDSNTAESIQNGIPHFQLGKLAAEADMRKVYACADVFVAPSREDNLPLVAIESLASGTPVVAFRIGGFPDLVSDSTLGYLAKPFDFVELATGIATTANSCSDERRVRIRQLAQAQFSSTLIAERYFRLYSSILAPN